MRAIQLGFLPIGCGLPAWAFFVIVFWAGEALAQEQPGGIATSKPEALVAEHIRDGLFLTDEQTGLLKLAEGAPEGAKQVLEDENKRRKDRIVKILADRKGMDRTTLIRMLVAEDKRLGRRVGSKLMVLRSPK